MRGLPEKRILPFKDVDWSPGIEVLLLPYLRTEGPRGHVRDCAGKLFLDLCNAPEVCVTLIFPKEPLQS